MQSNVVKAFRQRLVRAGYSGVKIRHYFEGLYIVDSISPSGQWSRNHLYEKDMAKLPEIKFFKDLILK